MKFLTLRKTTGRSYNAEVRNRKEYRNPDFLLHAVTYQDIDQIGTCFSKDVFDPHGYDKSDFYDEIGHYPFLLLPFPFLFYLSTVYLFLLSGKSVFLIVYVNF